MTTAPRPRDGVFDRVPLGVTATRNRRRTINVLILIGTTFGAALAAGSVDTRLYGAQPGDEASSLAVAAFLASLAAAVGLCFRLRSRRHLVLTAAVACLPPLVLPTDSTPALIGMASILVWHPDLRTRVGIVVAGFIVTLTAIGRDTRGTAPGTSFWNSLQHPDASTGTWPPMPWWQVALIATVVTGVFVAVALIRRSRRDATTHQREAAVATAQVRDLGRQVAVADERDALAREVHDVLGHRLSILAMQANALEIEAEASGASGLRERARQIQQGASGSMTDLRSLLTMLRVGPAAADRPHELADIAELVRECIDAGTPVNSNVFIDQSAPLDQVISRSAYRITTELLTNARKHAPGVTVQLDIRGGPRQGLTVMTSNSVPPTAMPAAGSRSGLTGVATRCRDVGGTFTAGPTPDGRLFVATARLPWRLPR